MEDFNLLAYMDITEAAGFLGYSKANVSRLIRQRKLQAVKRGRKYFVHIDELNNFIKVV